MPDNAVKKKLEAAKEATNKKFGAQAASLGNEHYKLNSVPSGILGFDYKSGIGGLPFQHMTEIFGANMLGKSTAFAYSVIAQVQKQGKLPALIATEPTFDFKWAEKLHGLDSELLLINRPDNAEEAFAMLRELVYDGLVDYIVLDSLGALAVQSEAEDSDSKRKAYGISGVVTSGLNAIMPRLYKNHQGLLIINQQRQDTKARQSNMTLYESPGGEALKHHASMRIQLKPGKERFMAKIDGDDVMVGRELILSFKKNKLAQAASKSARFNFFNIETDEYGLGIDHVSDIINTAKMAGVIEAAGAYLRHPSFPKGQVQGRKALAAYIEKEPKVVEVIRKEVMTKMLQNEVEAQRHNEELKAQDVQIETKGDTDDDNPDGVLLPNQLKGDS